jgi:hypothetical protein
VSRKRTHCYVISLHRAETADDFSPQEQDFIKELSHVLFPIVASHATALGSAPPSPARLAAVAPPATESGRERVARRFADRLRHAGVTLSAREIDACTALLAGDTVAAIADALGAAREHRRDLSEAGRGQARLRRPSWPDAMDAGRNGRRRDGSRPGAHRRRVPRLRASRLGT